MRNRREQQSREYNPLPSQSTCCLMAFYKVSLSAKLADTKIPGNAADFCCVLISYEGCVDTSEMNKKKEKKEQSCYKNRLLYYCLEESLAVVPFLNIIIEHLVFFFSFFFFSTSLWFDSVTQI